ncbi:choice-of-anchor P family protein [Nocardioides sp. SYSU D00038]|uniref:choice-of-anchor P family protein n=1 Tax=Nocardioides sp. SYSU D00038 TaxID=2812554 RepID=UPI0019681941|nr:choice-of-anchor P family protein [Nocardioides sp. SYSU D00038]
MKKRTISALAVLGVLLSTLIATTPAEAAKPRFFYYGTAGGSQVQALGVTVRSDLTASSTVAGSRWNVDDENRLARTNVASGLVKVGAVSTWARARKAGKVGTKIITGSRTADVSILGGLIKVDAVEVESTATKTLKGMSNTANTRFVGLEIAGKKYAVNVKKNLTITIPGIAYIILNGSVQRQVEGGSFSYGFGLYAQLLKPFKNIPAAATIVLGPTAAGVAPSPPAGAAVLGGQGYSSSITVSGGQLLSLETGPSAPISTPPSGTGGRTIQNATAEVNLPGVLHVGALKSTTSGSTVPGKARVTVSNQTAGLNVLNGLIKADAIRTTSTTVKNGKKNKKTTLSTEFVNLVIAGNKLPVNVSPNTKIDVAGLGMVTVNKQVKNKWGGGVYGVEIVLDTKRAGLPVGAVITLGAAISYVRPTSA